MQYYLNYICLKMKHLSSFFKANDLFSLQSSGNQKLSEADVLVLGTKLCAQIKDILMQNDIRYLISLTQMHVLLRNFKQHT